MLQEPQEGALPGLEGSQKELFSAQLRMRVAASGEGTEEWVRGRG